MISRYLFIGVFVETTQIRPTALPAWMIDGTGCKFANFAISPPFSLRMGWHYIFQEEVFKLDKNKSYDIATKIIFNMVDDNSQYGMIFFLYFNVVIGRSGKANGGGEVCLELLSINL